MLSAGAPYRGSGLFMCNEQCLRVRDSRFDVGGAGDSWITAKGHFAISHYPAPPTTSPSLRPHPLYPSWAYPTHNLCVRTQLTHKTDNTGRTSPSGPTVPGRTIANFVQRASEKGNSRILAHKVGSL